MIYIGSVRPYEVRLSNIVELTNEVIITLCAYWLVTFSDFVPDEKTKYDCGWPIIGATTLLVLFNLVVICYSTVANITHKCKLYCRRRKAIKLMKQKQQERQTSVYQAREEQKAEEVKQGANSEAPLTQVATTNST